MSETLKGRRVLVMGLGRFGGGVGVTRWLAAQGAYVTVTDQAEVDVLEESLREIADLDATLRLGGHNERDFRAAELVVVNPAVREESEYLAAAREAGVPVTTEINLFVERCPARIVGVTGSVGKSTVTAMIGHVLRRDREVERSRLVPNDHWFDGAVADAYRRVWVGGNIGRSLLDGLDEIEADDIVVLELSSFQLQRTPTVQWSPHVAVITNITPNHLDWHGNFAAYVAAKLNVVRYQQPERDVIVMQDSEDLRRIFGELFGDVSGIWRYGLEEDVPVAVQQSTAAIDCDDRRMQWDGLRLDVPGRHNRLNAAAALAATAALGVPMDEALAALATFEALPHRLQKVAERDGVVYYDDSKSTTPEAALTALAAMERPACVILGGYDKGSDWTELARAVAERTKLAVCIGTTGEVIAEAVRAVGGTAVYCGELAAAVEACQAVAESGDAILLSPACASWDQFVDYRARGEMFARLARGERA